MAGTIITITDAGRAALVAPGNAGTNARTVLKIGLSNGAFTADKGLTKLPNELKRITTFAGENVAPDMIHVTMRDDTADQYTLYGFGLYLENDVLFAVYSQPAPIMEKSPAAMVLLSADILFATIDAAQLVFGDASFTNPPATTERQGVVELATQAEVNAGADDSRAITAKTAAARYAALTGAVFTGPVTAAANVGDTDAQLFVKAPSGSLNSEAKQRFYATFGGTNNADTGTRFAASIRAGFNGGAWGKEYLDFWLNKGSANDTQTDTNQARVMRLLSGGRVLIGTVSDDGSNLLQVAGSANVVGTLTGGGGAVRGQINSDGLSAFYYASGNGNAHLGGIGTGFTSLVTGNNERLRVTSAGRILIATLTDDGSSVLQVAGNVSINRSSGEGDLLLGQNDGYFFGNAAQAGWYSPTKGAFRYNFADQTFQIGAGNYVAWHAGNLPNPAQTTGATMTGQLLLAEGSVTVPSLSFVNDGTPDTGLFHISDGVFGITCNGVEQVRFGTSGIAFARRPTFADATPWDSGNVTPLDRNTGGQINGNVTLYGASDYGSQLIFNSNGYAPRVQVQASSQIFMVTNGANTAANLMITDAGVVSFPRARPTWAGATPWDTGNFNPGSYVAKGGDTMAGRLSLTAVNSYGELGLRSTDGTWMFLRGRGGGGGMEWINNAYNNIVARMDDGGNFFSAGSIYTGNGSGILATDGNVYGGMWGGWLSNWLNSNINNLQNNINGKANAGARVQWDSGLYEFGAVDDGQPSGTVVAPAPYVMVGLRTTSGDDRIWMQAVVLRNQ